MLITHVFHFQFCSCVTLCYDTFREVLCDQAVLHTMWRDSPVVNRCSFPAVRKVVGSVVTQLIVDPTGFQLSVLINPKRD